MKTRQSPRNQDILFRQLFKPAAEPVAAVEPIDLSKAWWLSPRTKRQIERDRMAQALKSALKREGA